jgi:hypothetical protein
VLNGDLRHRSIAGSVFASRELRERSQFVAGVDLRLVFGVSCRSRLIEVARFLRSARHLWHLAMLHG